MIPGVVAAAGDSRVDVHVHFGVLPVDIPRSVTTESGGCSSAHDDGSSRAERISWSRGACHGFRLRYDDGTVFIVDEGGTRVWAVWPDSLTLEDTVVYLLGPVLALVLRVRGISCLHASAFSIDGRAIALAGPSGAGKSTTAAAFAGRGFPVLSDDLVALEEQGDCFVAHPGYPRLRLWPEAVDILYGTPDALPPLTPNWDKRYLDLQSGTCRFQGHPLGLSAVYLLGERRDGVTAPFVEAVTASDALLSLLANARGDVVLDKQSRRREFGLLGRLARGVPVKRVVGQPGSASLRALCDAIIGDVRLGSAPGISERRHTCTI